MKNVSLAEQFDEFIERSKFASKNDWDNAKLQEEFKRMIREEPRVPTWVTNEIARYPNNWSMDI